MDFSSSGDMKRVVAVNDMSCFGKCSLTVTLPVISAFGVEAVPLPTAILSTHTGGFSGFTCLDMTDEMKKIIAHWKTIGFQCDGIYTGYFTSPEQIDIVLDFIKEFSNQDTMIIVDPVMADNGKLYTGFNTEFVKDMKRLCGSSHVITPNITEALLLSDMEYSDIISRAALEECRNRLEGMGLKKAVITGVRLDRKSIGYAFFDFEAGETGEIFYPYEHMRLHGCGDVFASVLCGGMVQGMTFAEAVQKAGDFTERCIHTTQADIKNHWYGMKFEKNLREGI